MALVTVEELRTWGNFEAREFDWDAGREGELYAYLHAVIEQASARVQEDVGPVTYGTQDPLTAANLRAAELHLALALALERRLTVLSSHPEEGPPKEYIDLGQLERQIGRYRVMYERAVAAYRVGYEDARGSGFAALAFGVDETVRDTYPEVAFGEL